MDRGRGVHTEGREHLLEAGADYLAAPRLELRAFFRFTVIGRGVAVAAMLALVQAGSARPTLRAVGTRTLRGALWSAYALRFPAAAGVCTSRRSP